MDRINHEGKWHHLNRENVTALKRYHSRSTLAVINSKNRGKSTIVLQSLCCAFFITACKTVPFLLQEKTSNFIVFKQKSNKILYCSPSQECHRQRDVHVVALSCKLHFILGLPFRVVFVSVPCATQPHWQCRFCQYRLAQGEHEMPQKDFQREASALN